MAAMTPFPEGDELRFSQTLGPAMRIEDAQDAAQYFEALVAYTMRVSERGRAESERMARSNLGYYAGYYNMETQARVERLFGCVHPIFGAVADGYISTLEDALGAGMRMGLAMRTLRHNSTDDDPTTAHEG